MTVDRTMHHFLLLDHEGQLQAIRRLHAQGWSDYGISAATKLSVEQIRRLLSEHGHDDHHEAHA